MSVDLSVVCQRRTAAYSSAGCQENPRQRGRQRGLGAGQYSLGKWITLLAKYSVISSSGKGVEPQAKSKFKKSNPDLEEPSEGRPKCGTDGNSHVHS
jgi:hypothetical protein